MARGPATRRWVHLLVWCPFVHVNVRAHRPHAAVYPPPPPRTSWICRSRSDRCHSSLLGVANLPGLRGSYGEETDPNWASGVRGASGVGLRGWEGQRRAVYVQCRRSRVCVSGRARLRARGRLLLPGERKHRTPRRRLLILGLAPRRAHLRRRRLRRHTRLRAQLRLFLLARRQRPGRRRLVRVGLGPQQAARLARLAHLGACALVSAYGHSL